MGGTVALRSVNKNYSGELQFCSYKIFSINKNCLLTVFFSLFVYRHTRQFFIHMETCLSMNIVINNWSVNMFLELVLELALQLG